MKTLTRHFVQGLVVLVPLVATGYILWFVVTTLDSLIPVPVPGLGLAVTLLLVLVIGALASSVAGRKVFEKLEETLTRLPVVKLLYSSLRDLSQAFAGKNRSFGNPVVVRLDSGLKVLGFLTCSRFEDPQLAGHVAVYLPQSYNFAGNLLVVERERVHSIDADGAQFFAFVMSGGVAEMSGAQTMLEEPVFGDRASRHPPRS